jgi:hypothetical protein
LIESPIESFSELIHDFESASRSKAYRARSVIQHPTFDKRACAQQFDPDQSIPAGRCMPRRVCYELYADSAAKLVTDSVVQLVQKQLRLRER